MNKEEYEIFDRNMRVWGADNQLKLMSSKVTIIGLNNSTCEIAKNLVLSGVQVFLYDKEIITNHDIEKNWFYSVNDIGKSKDEILTLKIKDMTKVVKVQILDELSPEQTDIIITYLDDYEYLIALEKFLSNRKCKFYCVFSFDKYGAFYFRDFSLTERSIENCLSAKFEDKEKYYKKNSGIILFSYILNLFKNSSCIISDLTSCYDFLSNLKHFEKYKEVKNIIEVIKNLNGKAEDFERNSYINFVSTVIAGIVSLDIKKLITSEDNVQKNCEMSYFYDCNMQKGEYITFI